METVGNFLCTVVNIFGVAIAYAVVAFFVLEMLLRYLKDRFW